MMKDVNQTTTGGECFYVGAELDATLVDKIEEAAKDAGQTVEQFVTVCLLKGEQYLKGLPRRAAQ
jgi:hypothetical protein